MSEMDQALRREEDTVAEKREQNTVPGCCQGQEGVSLHGSEGKGGQDYDRIDPPLNSLSDQPIYKQHVG